MTHFKKIIYMEFKEYENIKLYHGDCMELLKQTPDNYYSLALVDPPYGLGASVVNSGGRFKRYHSQNGNWDIETPNDEYWNELFRVSKNQIVWGGNYFGLPPNRCFIIWDKQQPEGISFAMAEYAWTSFDKVAQICKARPQGQEQRFHPTQKPVDLYDFCLKHFAKQGDKILDTHLGSGSIAIAIDKANKINNMNLRFTGIELDEDYYNSMIKRFENYKSQLTLNLI